MNFFQKWVIEKFLKQYIKKGLDYVSGPLNGKKSEILGLILVLLLVGQGATDAASVKDFISLIIEQVSQVGDMPIGEAQKLTVYGLLLALIHRWTKQEEKKD